MADPLTHREMLEALVKAHALIMKDLLKLIAGEVNRDPADDEVVALASSLCERWRVDEAFRKNHRPHGAAVHRLLKAQHDLVKQIVAVEDALLTSIEQPGDEPTSH